MKKTNEQLKAMSYDQVLILCDDKLMERWWVVHDMYAKVEQAKRTLLNPANWSCG